MLELKDVNKHALDIATELSSDCRTWVTCEKIVSILLDRYSVTCFDEFGIGPVTNVPVLRLVNELNCKLTLYTDMYKAMHTRHQSGNCGFISYRDFEKGALSMLQSFALPAISHLHVRDPVCDDNEIDLDDASSESLTIPQTQTQVQHLSVVGSNDPQTIWEYGIGPLQKLPLVRSLFGDLPLDSKCVDMYLSRSDVLRFLLDFRNSGGDVLDAPDITFNVDQFRTYMLCVLTTSLDQLGIQLFANDKGVVHLGLETSIMLRSIESFHTSQAREWKREEQEMLMNEVENERVRAMRSANTVIAVPVLSIPSRVSSSQFFKKCIAELEKSGQYSPSFTKACHAVNYVINSMRKRESYSEQNAGVGKKRQKKNETEKQQHREYEQEQDRGESLDEVQLLAEYLMLHVGSSKYRRGKFKCQDETSVDAISVEHVSQNWGETKEITHKYNEKDKNMLALSRESHQDKKNVGEEFVVEDIEALEKPLVASPDFIFETKTHQATSAMVGEVIHSDNLRGLCVSANWNSTTNKNYSTNFDIKAVGRWGEALVFQYLTLRHPKAEVIWVNKDSESMACYDLKIEEPVSLNGCVHIVTTFVEVKTSRFNALNTFEISPNEWAFASGTPSVHYDVYRVYNAGDSNNVRVQIVRDLYNSVKEQRVRLCLAL